MVFPPPTSGLGQQESSVDRGGGLADGDLPIPGSPGLWYTVPAGCHVTALYCKLAQLEGVQLRSGKAVLPVLVSVSPFGLGPDPP